MFYLFIHFFRETKERRGGERERDRQTLICCSTYLCIHWLILVCALIGYQTHNLGVLGWCPNQLSYPARASWAGFYWFPHHPLNTWLRAFLCSSLVLSISFPGASLPGSPVTFGTHGSYSSQDFHVCVPLFSLADDKPWYRSALWPLLPAPALWMLATDDDG